MRMVTIEQPVLFFFLNTIIKEIGWKDIVVLGFNKHNILFHKNSQLQNKVSHFNSLVQL